MQEHYASSIQDCWAAQQLMDWGCLEEYDEENETHLYENVRFYSYYYLKDVHFQLPDWTEVKY